MQIVSVIVLSYTFVVPWPCCTGLCGHSVLDHCKVYGECHSHIILYIYIACICALYVGNMIEANKEQSQLVSYSSLH